MAGFYGGDTNQMRGHAAACARGAQRITDLAAALHGAINDVTWEGPDAEAFRQLWNGSVQPRLTSRADAVRAVGAELDSHAQEQDQTSGTDGTDSILDTIGETIGDLLDGVGIALGDGLGALQKGLGDLFQADGPGEQSFYGAPGYGTRGGVIDQERPVGTQFEMRGDVLSGREIENEAGHIDAHAGVNDSAGVNGSTDPYGNMTGTIGARGSAEVGVDTHLNGPLGTSVDISHRIGAEVYAEGGGTIGPDGGSVGAKVGYGVYGVQEASTSHESGASVSVTTMGFAGADAHANAYGHLTRNADGQVNGWSVGVDAGAFAGEQATQKFEVTAPNGWFSSSTSVSAKPGGGVGFAAGGTFSTDEVSLSVGGFVATGLGFGGSTKIAINPNAIVESITPGDYNLDDAISDVKGAFDAVRDGADKVLSALNPFD